MWAEFKEKTFETAFVGELRLVTKFVYAPDQCDENFLGFDASAFVPWEFLPPILHCVRSRRWHHMVGISAKEIDQFGKELNRRLPPFRLNLFLQFKRPQYLERKNAAEWSFWKQKYFRYKLESQQQKLLSKIGVIGKGRAVAVYAVPAFHKSDALFKHQIDNAVIENTNVLNAALLSGHSKCTFVKAGSSGMGHSEPEEISCQPIREIIDEHMSQEGVLFTRHIKDTADTIKQLFEDEEDSKETLFLARRAILGGDLSEISPHAVGSWFDAVITVAAFSSAFGVRVCALG